MPTTVKVRRLPVVPTEQGTLRVVNLTDGLCIIMVVEKTFKRLKSRYPFPSRPLTHATHY